MSIWFFLWLLLSLAILYFVLWTFLIQLRQKKIWQRYAKRKKLRYTPNSFLSPPEMRGSFEDYTVSFFTGEHMAADMRGSRKLTALEVYLREALPLGCAVASGGMVQVSQNMGFREEFRPEQEGWDKSYIAASENRAVLKSYLTPERLEALLGVLNLKNAWVIFVSRGDMALLRVDTPDPLDSEEKLDKLLRKVIDCVRVLELRQGEGARLKSDAARKTERETAVRIDSKDVGAVTFELEEDEPAAAAAPGGVSENPQE